MARAATNTCFRAPTPPSSSPAVHCRILFPFPLTPRGGNAETETHLRFWLRRGSWSDVRSGKGDGNAVPCQDSADALDAVLCLFSAKAAADGLAVVDDPAASERKG